jgi:hypothetical protein
MLMERIDLLAYALGACSCLGEDDACELCHGRGIPGSFLPDKKAFAEYVLPVLNKLRKYKRNSKHNKSRKVNNNLSN